MFVGNDARVKEKIMKSSALSFHNYFQLLIYEFNFYFLNKIN
jgi:hypothetical protein